jgi:inner membrane protein
MRERAVQRSLLIKSCLVAAILVGLGVPLRLIDGLVAERAARQQAMARELADQSYAPQVLAGPILSIPYREERDGAAAVERVARFFPTSNSTEGNVTVETKTRGLFKARVFEWHGTLRGEFAFDGAPDVARSRADSRLVWGKATLTLLIRDPRGLTEPLTIEWAGRALPVARGSGLAHVESGVHATIADLDPGKPQRIAYSIALGVHGTETLALVPLAGSDRLTLTADWPYPSFGGQFLPEPAALQRSAQGFDAKWSVTALASNAQQQTLAWIDGKSECRDGCADHLEVRFIDPIDIYSLSDRAVKYGFLFVALTFGALALFETLKATPLHPVQYLLVGLALATFFLLLFALSEHIAFGASYALAALACVGLIGFYLRGALRGAYRGALFAALLAALYAALYGLLISEDNALLLGSLLVFGLIAAAMAFTRNVDWYSLGRNAA